MGSKRKDLYYYLVSSGHWQWTHCELLTLMYMVQRGEDQGAGTMPDQAEADGLLAIVTGSNTTFTTLTALF